MDVRDLVQRLVNDMSEMKEGLQHLERRVSNVEHSSEHVKLEVKDMRASMFETVLSGGGPKPGLGTALMMDDLRDDVRHVALLNKSVLTIEEKLAALQKDLLGVAARLSRQEKEQQSVVSCMKNSPELSTLQTYLNSIEAVRSRQVRKPTEDTCGVQLSRSLELCFQSEEQMLRLAQENKRLQQEAKRSKRRQQQQEHEPRQHPNRSLFPGGQNTSLLSDFGQNRRNISLKKDRAKLPATLDLADKLFHQAGKKAARPATPTQSKSECQVTIVKERKSRLEMRPSPPMQSQRLFAAAVQRSVPGTPAGAPEPSGGMSTSMSTSGVLGEASYANTSSSSSSSDLQLLEVGNATPVARSDSTKSTRSSSPSESSLSLEPIDD